MARGVIFTLTRKRLRVSDGEPVRIPKQWIPDGMKPTGRVSKAKDNRCQICHAEFKPGDHVLTNRIGEEVTAIHFDLDICITNMKPRA